MTPGELLKFAASLPPESLAALVSWLSGKTDEPPEALTKLPTVLQSELALARFEERARSRA